MKGNGMRRIIGEVEEKLLVCGKFEECWKIHPFASLPFMI